MIMLYKLKYSKKHLNLNQNKFYGVIFILSKSRKISFMCTQESIFTFFMTNCIHRCVFARCRVHQIPADAKKVSRNLP